MPRAIFTLQATLSLWMLVKCSEIMKDGGMVQEAGKQMEDCRKFPADQTGLIEHKLFRFPVSRRTS